MNWFARMTHCTLRFPALCRRTSRLHVSGTRRSTGVRAWASWAGPHVGALVTRQLKAVMQLDTRQLNTQLDTRQVNQLDTRQLDTRRLDARHPANMNVTIGMAPQPAPIKRISQLENHTQPFPHTSDDAAKHLMMQGFLKQERAALQLPHVRSPQVRRIVTEIDAALAKPSQRIATTHFPGPQCPHFAVFNTQHSPASLPLEDIPPSHVIFCIVATLLHASGELASGRSAACHHVHPIHSVRNHIPAYSCPAALVELRGSRGPTAPSAGLPRGATPPLPQPPPMGEAAAAVARPGMCARDSMGCACGEASGCFSCSCCCCRLCTCTCCCSCRSCT